MKKLSLFLLLAIIMAGCRNDSNIEVVDDYYQDDTIIVARFPDTSYDTRVDTIETTDDRDLKVETKKHVIEMVGNPGTKYKYHIWTGGKDANGNEPDIVVDQGRVMVRKQNQ